MIVVAVVSAVMFMFAVMPAAVFVKMTVTFRKTLPGKMASKAMPASMTAAPRAGIDLR